MKALLFIFIITITVLNADSLYPNGRCVKDFYTTNSNRLILNYSDGKQAIVKINRSSVDFLLNNQNEFSFINGNCVPVFGDKQKAFLSSLVGILIGFTILFFSILITIKVGAKRW